jgi:repressor LexA
MASNESSAQDPRIGPPLHAREARVLNYVIEHLRRLGYQPSIREISDACNLPSTKTVSEVIASLAEKGYIELPQVGSRARALRIVGLEISITRTFVSPRDRKR